MTRTMVLVASMVVVVLIAAGVAFAATVRCPTGGNGLCVGTPQDDTMTGTADFSVERIYGRGGDDTIRGGDFEDHIEGEGGNDTIFGEGGRNELYGDSRIHAAIAGDDLIYGGPSDDEIHGGPGEDRIRGNPGTDTVYGGGGNDSVWGGTGGLHFGVSQGESPSLDDGYDIVHGGNEADYIRGGYGTFYGYGGDDHLSVFGARSNIHGGPGDDRLGLGTYLSNDRRAYTQVANGDSGEDHFGISLPSRLVKDEFVYWAVDGEHDVISCYDKKKEVVRADRLDTFNRYSDPGGTFEIGRQYCDYLTIAK